MTMTSPEEVRSGRMPYVKLDVLHRRMLQQIVPRFGLEKLLGTTNVLSWSDCLQLLDELSR